MSAVLEKRSRAGTSETGASSMTPSVGRATPAVKEILHILYQQTVQSTK
jgi:hypothetical protein